MNFRISFESEVNAEEVRVMADVVEALPPEVPSLLEISHILLKIEQSEGQERANWLMVLTTFSLKLTLEEMK